ncbi:MAG: protein phosphatase 2C domain-containing protein [Acidobacteria bacterium]|nr:protein phosphatase 2C domain-containing protein [Acidobacteriota bacterium]
MAELPTINLALYAQTDVGMVRSGNEDNFLILDLSTGKSWTASEQEPKELLTYTQGYYGSLLAVSDGMGGALAGEVASRLAVDTVRDRMLQLQAHDRYSKIPFHERLRVSIEQANILIHGESQTNPAHKGLGATFTAVATQGNQIFFAQVGDSRAYLIRQGKIFRTTKDQSLVQQLIDAGQITEEEAETHSYRNVILQALGAHNNVNVEVSSLPLCQLDTLVICSDGLSGKIHNEEIEQVINEASDFKSACQTLIDIANERGGEDNITVVIAQFSGTGLWETSIDPIDPQILARAPDTPTEIDWEMGETGDTPDTSQFTHKGPVKTDGEPRPTEPLQSTSAPTAPITARLPRNPPTPLPDRRGPITSVFSAEDIAEETELVTQRLAQVTAPLDPRQTRPLAAEPTNNIPNEQDNAPATPSEPQQSTPHPEKTNSRKGLYFLACLLTLSVVGLAVGATLYLKQQADARTATEQAEKKRQRDNQDDKEGKIGRLREKIAEINKKLQSTNKQALIKKREILSENLKNMSLRLDEINKIPSENHQLISKGCKEVEKGLKEIEDEVNNIIFQGLQPLQSGTRRPVKV